MIPEPELEISFPVMQLNQPIGSFFVGKMSAKDLVNIAWLDVRRLSSNTEFDDYLGIQRKINPDRAKEIAKYGKYASENKWV